MLICHVALAQEHINGFTKEVLFVSDNDNYLIQKRDGYYTNGSYLSFQHLARSTRPGTTKAIMRYEIGQMIFNPYKYSVTNPEQMDRPFAGYLFVKASRSRFFKNGANLQYGLSVGMLGSSSGAKQTQRAYHDLINIYQVEGWDYQLADEFGVNLGAQYTHPVTPAPRQGQVIDLHAIGKASLGNTFTNATAGLLLRIGFMEAAEQSVAWSSRLQKNQPSYRHKSEAFLFFQPEAMYQAYNATLQGGLFAENKGPVTADIEPWLYQHRVGVMFAGRRMSTVLAIVHRTKEAKQMRRKENYGSIQISYRFN